MDSQIRALLEPITEELGVDILKVSLGGGGRNPLLKVVVDRAEGVNSEVLERISRGLALQLDAEDLVSSAYRLEVTSPGLDWPLETVADFKRYQGEWLKVSFVEGTTQEGRNLGPVEAEGDVKFTLLIEAKKSRDNREEVISMAEVNKVVRAINWKEVSRTKQLEDSAEDSSNNSK